MTYRVALRKTDDGYSVSCPGLPGCWSEGQTEDEALAGIQDDIALYLDVAADLARDGAAEVREVDVAA